MQVSKRFHKFGEILVLKKEEDEEEEKIKTNFMAKTREINGLKLVHPQKFFNFSRNISYLVNFLVFGH